MENDWVEKKEDAEGNTPDITSHSGSQITSSAFPSSPQGRDFHSCFWHKVY